MRRLQCGLGLAVLWVSRQLRCPKVSKEASEKPFDASAGAYHFSCRKLNAQTTARVVGLPSYGLSPASASEGFQRASGSPLVCPQAHTHCPGGE